MKKIIAAIVILAITTGVYFYRTDFADASLLSNTGQYGSSAPIITPGISTIGAKLIFITIEQRFSSGGISPSDSAGNTWVQLFNTNSLGAYYAINPITSGSDTFSFNSNCGGNSCSLSVLAFSDNVTALDKSTSADPGDSGTSVQPGSITPTQNGDLLIADLVTYGLNGSSLSINGSFNLTNFINSSNFVVSADAYEIQTTAAPINPTWTIPSGESYGVAAGIAAFKVSSSPSVTPVPIANVTVYKNGNMSIKQNGNLTITNKN
jgi:hypothetical protein